MPKVKKIRSVNLPKPLGPPRPVAGHLYLFYLTIMEHGYCTSTVMFSQRDLCIWIFPKIEDQLFWCCPPTSAHASEVICSPPILRLKFSVRFSYPNRVSLLLDFVVVIIFGAWCKFWTSSLHCYFQNMPSGMFVKVIQLCAVLNTHSDTLTFAHLFVAVLSCTEIDMFRPKTLYSCVNDNLHTFI
jgi:hypothetical protein